MLLDKHKVEHFFFSIKECFWGENGDLVILPYFLEKEPFSLLALFSRASKGLWREQGTGW